MTTQRIPVHLPIPPWFRDHHFNSRVLLPAVEAMRLLAVTTQAVYPALDVWIMQQGRFAKFLELPPKAARIEVLVELETRGSDEVCAKLLTRTQLKTMARMTNHCELCFVASGSKACKEVKAPWPSRSAPVMEVSADQVYRELVPFGPAYRTLRGQLSVGHEWARGMVLAPDLPLALPAPVGSPFPLDGAMHAACVHGQHRVDFIPFPVGFATRIIHRPTLPGEQYAIDVGLQSQGADELVYDLHLRDQTGRLRETILGLRMRDVSGGRIRPPAWIHSAPGQQLGSTGRRSA